MRLYVCFIIFVVFFSQKLWAQEATMIDGGSSQQSENFSCNPDQNSEECKVKQKQCKKDFKGQGFTQPEDSVLKCKVHQQCQGIAFTEHASKCLEGAGVSFVQVYESGKSILKGTVDLFTGESYRNWIKNMNAEITRMKPCYEKVRAVCGVDPRKDKKYYEHQILYSQRKINPLTFEEGELKRLRAQKKYLVCETKVLDKIGAYGNEKLLELIVSQLKLLGVKWGCYSSVYKTKLFCQMTTYLAGGAASTLAALKIFQMTGVALRSYQAARLANHQRNLPFLFENIIKNSPHLRVSQARGEAFHMGLNNKTYVIFPNIQARAWALEKNLIKEFTKDQIGSIKLTPGQYNFTVLKDGKMVIGKVDDTTEYGVRHVNLANERPVVSAGQIRMNADGSYEFNVGSGTFGDALAEGAGGIFHYQDDAGYLVEAYLGRSGKNLRYDDRITSKSFPTEAKMKSLCGVAQFSGRNKRNCCRVYGIGCGP